MKKVILLFVLALFYSNLVAQWISTSGPNETGFESLHANGTTIFAGTSGYGGIYRSTDNGSSWIKKNDGLTDTYSVHAFCNIGTKIVTGIRNNIYISSNNGDSWQKITPLNNNGDVIGLGYDGTYLYAALPSRGVTRTSDEGVTWSISSAGITDLDIRTLLVTTNKIFIGTNMGGVFSSADKGLTWQETNTGMTNKNAIRSFALNGSNLFVSSYFGGIYGSTDNGVTWNAVNNGLSTINVRKIYSFGIYLFASTDGGIFRSTNQGVSWVASNNGITTNYSNSFINVGNNLFVIASSRGIYKSMNNGDLWVQSNNGITNSTIKTLVKSGSNLFAGAYYSGGVHYTNNGGVSWSSTYPSISYVVQLVKDNNVIYAATWGWGLFKTSDNGTTWTRISQGLTNQNIFSVALIGSRIFVGTDNSGVFSTSDNGTTWVETNSGLTNQNINMLTVVGSAIYAATAGGVFISNNNGSLWTPAGLAGKNIITLKANNNKIFAGTWGEGVYVTSNNGTTWTQIKNGMTSLNIFALTFDSNNNIYAAAAANVYSSKDGGENWVLKNEGLPYEVYSIEVVDNYLYAGTNSFGVWKRPLSELITDVEKVNTLSTEFSLEQNYPNPFNPSTRITYHLPAGNFVTLKVYDILGKEVATLVNEYKEAGKHIFQFSTLNSQLASGVYFCTLCAGNQILTNKMILTK